MPNMSKRAFFAAVAAAALTMSLSACGGADSSTSSPTGSRAMRYELVQSGVVTAATLSTQPPFAMTDKDGAPTGFAVDLMNEAAKRLHVKVQYKTTDLAGVLSGLTAGRYDIGVGGFGATPERKRHVSFTAPYYWGTTAVVTKKSDKQSRLSDFDGKRVGVVSGAVQEAFIAKKMPKAKAVQFKDQTALISQLLSGGIDAMVLGGADAEVYVAKQPVRIAVSADSTQGTGFPLRKNGDPKFLSDIDAQINEMIDDGTYVKLYRKYFNEPVAASLLKERPNLKQQVAGTDLAPKG
ncbi:substrate-binding periplasmic protein [Streptomyces sioyaensis]|uniref:substrate-binding periplasmic protein n=1 Tax=Streptomyces sioyaensis TaxID=67364 RepID=UPI00366A2D60